jgi:predicted nucleic acid-binding protein
MSFWDASALVSLVLLEDSAEQLQRYWAVESEVVVWWGTTLECESAIARRAREGLRPAEVALARTTLVEIERFWIEVPPDDSVRDLAATFVRRRALRAGDSLQLAAAAHISASRAELIRFVTLDSRLAQAAAAEGFPVYP